MFVMYKACIYLVKVLDLGWELEPFQCRLLHSVFFCSESFGRCISIRQRVKDLTIVLP